MSEQQADPLPPVAPLDNQPDNKRGRLKIFLGAAPGVGKTYAMLKSAALRRQDGVDVVAGIVDSHGRKEVAELLQGMESLAPLGSDLDVDAVLKRRPRLVLVDDLAHVNVGNGWHARRYEDVEHLLEAGIDVYTTLNIQDLASLSDIITQIVRINIDNPVPDRVIQSADEMELVDIAPPELLLRLKQGKIFLPKADAHAVEQYFTIGNLTALRELALRHMAERVDQQMLRYRQAHAISGVWPTRERIIVCIGDAPIVSRLIRITKRIADRRKVPWIALYVETHRHATYNEEQRGRINEAMRLAEQLGAELVTIAGEDPATEIMACATSRNVTQIIVGKSERPRWMSIISPSVVDRLLHFDSNIDVLVVGPDNGGPVREIGDRPDPVVERPPVDWMGYAKALYALTIASILSLLLSTLNAQYHNYAVIYLTAVILVAIRQGRRPALFAAVLTAPILHFLFGTPRYSLATLYMIDPIALIVFLGATMIISNLAERVRGQIHATRLSERRSKNLYDFNRKVASAAGLDDVLWAVVHHVASTIGGSAIVMMPKAETLEIAASYPPEMALNEISVAAADWAWRQGKKAGKGSSTLPNAEWLFLPLKTARGSLGVLGVQIQGKRYLPTSDEARLLDTLADQAAVAVERTNLVSDFEETRILMETEKLRGALLSSLSHDLRTPLVSILGSATTLIDLEESLDKPARHDLLLTIREEAERLNRFVQNLLDMTRLGSGALKPRQDWVEIGDVIGSALRRLTRQIGQRQVEVSIEPNLPMLYVDFVLIEQVLVNIVENACKYSPPGSRIHIAVKRKDGMVLVRICDSGKGIPVTEREKVFDMFYRVKATDTQIAGTGLGLAICRGIIEAHKGLIRVADTDTSEGACIEFTLPVQDAPRMDDAEGPPTHSSEWDA